MLSSCAHAAGSHSKASLAYAELNPENWTALPPRPECQQTNIYCFLRGDYKVLLDSVETVSGPPLPRSFAATIFVHGPPRKKFRSMVAVATSPSGQRSAEFISSLGSNDSEECIAVVDVKRLQLKLPTNARRRKDDVYPGDPDDEYNDRYCFKEY